MRLKGSHVYSVPVEAVIAMLRDESATVDKYEGLQVKIPILGGKVADWVGKNDGQRTLDAEFAFNDRRLGAR